MIGLICAGTGRDGTLSLNSMLEAVFAEEGRGRCTMHEYGAVEFYRSWCEWRETGAIEHRADLERRIVQCPYDAIVGNGYAAVLRLFAGIGAAGGLRPKLIHLQRRDRDACIASLVRNAEMFPAAYGYYIRPPGPMAAKRMAAIHFGEATPAEWEALPLPLKFGWFYDKTHDLIAAAHHHFADVLHVHTEELSLPETRRRVAAFVAGEAVSPPAAVHLNSHALIAVDRVPADRRDKLQWLFGRLDLERTLKEDPFLVEYVLNQFIAWTGYQISGAIADISPADRRSAAEIQESLARAAQALGKTARDIELLLIELEGRLQSEAAAE